MKVLFYGNQGNTSFRYARWLVEKGVEVALYFPSNFQVARSLPEWEDPTLKNRYPSWVKTFRFSPWHIFFPPKFLRKASLSCDVLFTTGNYIVSALLLDLPVVFMPVGSDILELPFKCNRFRDELLSYTYRRRIRRISRILTFQENCVHAAELLGCRNKIRYLGICADVDQINECCDTELLGALEKKYSRFDKVFVNLSRKNLNPTDVAYKGTDKFLYAFEKVYRHDNRNIKLILGMHGHDIDACHSLVKKLRLENAVDFVDHLALPQLHAYLSLSNGIVFDDFGKISSTVGGIVREAFAVGAVVVGNIDIASWFFTHSYGPDCPIFFAYTTEEIEAQMQKLLDMETDDFFVLKRKAKDWAYRYLDWRSRIDEFMEILQQAAVEHKSHSNRF